MNLNSLNEDIIMRNVTLTVLLALAPGIAAAQASASGHAEAQTSATANLTVERPAPDQRNTERARPAPAEQRAQATRGLSAAARSRAEATFATAQRQDLPEQPLASAMLEAQAKGATEVQVVGAGQQALARLQAAKQAMVQAGRPSPSQEEVSRGANVLARGATSAELEALVQWSPPDRSLVVAFETLTQLTARGVPVTSAVAEIGSKLDARASDDAIRSLGTSLTTGANAAGGMNGGAGQVGGAAAAGTSAGAATSAGGAAGQTAGGASAAGSLTGGVAGGLTRP